ncbi:MAG TPA: FKBP-type peptidyl-prolyl cis-trans isomerase [Candidatus Pacearchaeota archaeon]|nr:FKBP-type peptidyl-prolyl cis-trans isomerase [Candidatus Pacearchaeota archaeon]HPR79996.1 FKBP-type peptidyl-prolyl cis-trans isomerase [Candidatus Pacearchaeota archaeon]
MKVEKKTVLLIVILLVIALAIFLLMKPKELMAPNGAKNTDQASLVNKMDEVKIEVLQEGTGEVSKKGDTLTVNYTGTLTDGTQFDSSVGKTPFSFTLGENRVIQGWEQGMLNMKVGEKRRLTIPSDLGYGPQGYPGVIPGNATLIFEVELLKIN